MKATSSSLAVIAYLVVAIAITWPLASQLSTAVPSDLGDPLLNAWILWWNAHTIPLTPAWWNAPAFYPADGALALSEHLLGISLIAAPVQWLGGSPQLAYNLAFLLSFPLSAFSAYLLTLELTGQPAAALIGGLLFGFAPYRIAHLAHLQVLSSYWMPLSLLGLHKYLGDRRPVWLALFGAAWLLQALSNGYYMLFFSVLVTLWVLWFARPGLSSRQLMAIMGAWLVAVVPLVPLLWRYRSIHIELGLTRSIQEIQTYSADIGALLNATAALAVWGPLRVYDRPEGYLFPGVTVILLVGSAALLTWWTQRSDARPRSRWSVVRVALGWLALCVGLVALSVALFGPWRIEILGLSIFSVRDPGRSLLLTLVITLVLVTVAAVAAYRRRSVLGFYLVAALVMWLLSLGPAPTLLGERLTNRGPYALLMWLPGFDAIRVPARFAMIMTLCLAVAGSLLFGRLAAEAGRWRLVLVGVVGLGILADGWPTALPLHALPPQWAAARCAPPNGALIELPLGGRDRDIAAMYRSMLHRHPVVNGYSGYFPPHYAALRHGLSSFDEDLLSELAARGVTHAIVDEGATRGEAWSRYVAQHRGAVRVCSAAEQTLYRLPAHTTLPPPSAAGEPLPIRSIQSNVDAKGVRAMTDGDPSTRWGSESQSDLTQIDVDLGEVRQVEAIVLSLGPFVEDFPRALLIETTEDGQRWGEAWRGRTARLAFVAAFERPRDVPMRFTFPARGARFLRLRLLSSDPVYYWSVAELAVLGSSSRIPQSRRPVSLSCRERLAECAAVEGG